MGTSKITPRNDFFDKSMLSIINPISEKEINLTHELTQKIAEILLCKKEQIIKQKLEEKGFSHLLNNIEGRRFKKIMIERSEDSEKYYVDNGTDEGLLIVTFTDIDCKFSNDFLENKIISELKYY